VPTATSVTHELIELKLGEDLAAFVAARRTGRPVWSWQELADELSERTGVVVSREFLRTRFSI
jgi:ribosome-binding protein aMBF1 (putative translation factor)